MKRTQTTTTKDYDKDGVLLRETTETVVEEDDGYIYPQNPIYPWWLSTGNPNTYHPEITCATARPPE